MTQQYPLCPLSELVEGECRGIHASASAYADVILLRRNDQLYAYRNCCPHSAAPMEDGPNEFLDYTGHYIRCALHGALFRITDGYCIEGPCRGRSLEPLTLQVENDIIFTLEKPSKKSGKAHIRTEP